MVSIEISAIIYGAVGILVATVGFLLARTFKRYDIRIDKSENEFDELRQNFDKLLGEHEVIKEQCKKRRR